MGPYVVVFLPFSFSGIYVSLTKNSAQALLPDDDSDHSVDDSLPPFSALTNDEEREAKARSRDPGTYLVVANPGSFASLPEYAESSPSSSFQSTGPFPGHENNIESMSSHTDNQEDPNVIILRTFEDPSRRPSIATISSSKSPSPKATFSSSSCTPQLQTALPYRASHPQPGRAALDQETVGGGEAHLLQYYRTNISPHIINVSAADGRMDVFEEEARRFPPVSCCT